MHPLKLNWFREPVFIYFPFSTSVFKLSNVFTAQITGRSIPHRVCGIPADPMVM